MTLRINTVFSACCLSAALYAIGPVPSLAQSANAQSPKEPTEAEVKTALEQAEANIPLESASGGGQSASGGAPSSSQSSGPHPISYDCDSRPGRISQIRIPAGPPPFTVTGKISGVDANNASEEKPMAWAGITAAARLPQFDNLPLKKPTVGVGLAAAEVDGKTGYYAGFVNTNYSTSTDSRVVSLPADYIDFTLYYDGEKVTAAIFGRSKSATYEVAHPALALACSPGQFEFTEIVITPGPPRPIVRQLQPDSQ